MRSLIFLTAVVLLVVSSVHGQFEAGFVKILEDQRYQDGARFGNFRNQEDGIKYKEETDEFGIRTGFWEYPDETGKIVHVQFEAGPGIGFRIVSSNIVAPTPIAGVPVKVAAAPLPVVRQPQPTVRVQPKPAAPFRQQVVKPTPAPAPVNIFDYPADLQFFRDSAGHRFIFTAV